ncbi:uncharacterized protein LOC135391796 isoform X1 [Ornithodoros turicata]|uniref:uncharacterized protein LOC135391796 isoform X1 n=1 Tax=Ornithodoros turicata TaxID=34597 RepID=UPI0031394775
MMSDIYVHLLSNASMDKFPSNKLNAFTVAFDSPLQLSNRYKVGLMDLSISNDFLNIGYERQDAKIEVSFEDTVEAGRTFRVTSDLERDLGKALSEFDVSFAYNKSRYDFVLPVDVKAVELDPRLAQALDASLASREAGRAVKPPKLSEREATSIVLEHAAAAVAFGDVTLNSETTSLRNTLNKYFQTHKLDASLEFADNVYSLKTPKGLHVPEPFVKLLHLTAVEGHEEETLRVSLPVARQFSFTIKTKIPRSLQVHVPPGYYATPQALLNAINQRVGERARFSFDGTEQKCKIRLSEGTSTLRLSEYLAVLLGFESRTVFTGDEDATSSVEVLLEPPFHNIIVYTDIVEPTYVGSGKKPILKILPFYYEKDKHVVTYTLDNIQYFNLSQFEIPSVTIVLADETGRRLPLRSKGRTNLTLHFKYVP